MIYFLFFLIYFIISDDNTNKNDDSPISDQTITNIQEKNSSLNENNSNQQESSSKSSNDSNTSVNQTNKSNSHFPHRTLKRMNATNNIPKLLIEEESTTVGVDQNESLTDQTPKINPLRRRNAKINIPKVDFNEENEKESQKIKNSNQNQPNPDFDNDEAFREDPSDPFDDEDEDKIMTEDKNTQKTPDQNKESKDQTPSESSPFPTETSTPIPTKTPTETPLPLQTETPTQEPTSTPTPSQTEISTPAPTEEQNSDETITDFEELSHDEISASEPFTNDDTEKSNHKDSNTHLIKDNDKDLSDSVEKPAKKKLPKFHIVSVSPQAIYSRGDEKIEITMNTTLDGPPFIKFGENKIVTGRHSKKDLTVKCRTPKLQEGEINISVSIDKIKWCEPFSLVVVADEAELPWMFVGCAGLAIIAISLMVSKLICGKRAVPKKKKHSKYHDDDILNIMAPNYSSNDLRKRTKIPTEV